MRVHGGGTPKLPLLKIGARYGDYEVTAHADPDPVYYSALVWVRCWKCGWPRPIPKAAHELRHARRDRCTECNPKARPGNEKPLVIGEAFGDWRVTKHVRMSSLGRVVMLECHRCKTKKGPIVITQYRHLLRIHGPTGPGFICRTCKPRDRRREKQRAR